MEPIRKDGLWRTVVDAYAPGGAMGLDIWLPQESIELNRYFTT